MNLICLICDKALYDGQSFHGDPAKDPKSEFKYWCCLQNPVIAENTHRVWIGHAWTSHKFLVSVRQNTCAGISLYPPTEHDHAKDHATIIERWFDTKDEATAYYQHLCDIKDTIVQPEAKKAGDQ